MNDQDEARPQFDPVRAEDFDVAELWPGLALMETWPIGLVVAWAAHPSKAEAVAQYYDFREPSDMDMGKVRQAVRAALRNDPRLSAWGVPVESMIVSVSMDEQPRRKIRPAEWQELAIDAVDTFGGACNIGTRLEAYRDVQVLAEGVRQVWTDPDEIASLINTRPDSAGNSTDHLALAVLAQPDGSLQERINAAVKRLPAGKNKEERNKGKLVRRPFKEALESELGVKITVRNADAAWAVYQPRPTRGRPSGIPRNNTTK